MRGTWTRIGLVLLAIAPTAARAETLRSERFVLEAGTFTSSAAAGVRAADGAPELRADLAGNAAYGISSSPSGTQLEAGFAVIAAPEPSGAVPALAAIATIARLAARRRARG